ncbi:30S ribosome-binding factor RbfA [Spiribacter vilamensis]|uniref:Ribosome-binding factor A n=1 Tax=Spiribacter vilamensis TaxID=531306 RepID=A0A4Q8D0N7_9GAMM|nr:30S ribosome-binding factor RbfA [Spiribacter vilamensis]RZU98853.1 ribosome-binding factor A [Spiribacter vilamensis]TVO62129.1 30S ribosome-binding factor RbfA [Spiribacter vilamensis]
MPRDFSRARRVGDQIQQELAGLIRDQVRDPRVGSVTVSEVRVSRDFSYADVFVTGLGMEPDESREMVRVLTGAGNFLRRELARRLTLRKVPLLRFQYDPTFDRGARLNRLIDDVQPDGDPAAPDKD